MVRVVDCHAGVLGSNPGGPRYFPLGITSLVAAVIRERLSRPLGAVAGSPRLWLMPGSQKNKRGKSVVTVPFLTASLLG